MNIYTVRDNLKNTIAGKEVYRERLLNEEPSLANSVMCEMLRINIDELKVILFDVEKCSEEWNLMSWQVNPERMGQ